jgi:hypothetical protein
MNDKLAYSETLLPNNENSLNIGEQSFGVIKKLFGLALGNLHGHESIQKNHAALPSYRFETIQLTELAPPPLKIIETKRVSLNDKAYAAYGRLCMMATQNLVKSEPEAKNDTDSKDEKRNKVIGGLAILGAGVVVAGSIYIATKGGTNFSSHHEIASHITNSHHKHGPHSVGKSHHKSHKPRSQTFEKPTRKLMSKKSDYLRASLPKGSNLWLESKKELGKNASLQAIAKRDALLVKLNHLTYASARHLNIGYRYLYPR